MKSPPAILWVSGAGEMAGAEHSMLILLQNLNRKYPVGLVCPRGGTLAQKMQTLEIPCFWIPRQQAPLRSLPGMWQGLMRNLALFSILHRWQGRYVHANNFPALLITLLPAFFTRKILIAHVRDLNLPRWFIRLCSLFCHQFIAVSRAVKHHLIAGGADPRKISVIYNPVCLPSSPPATPPRHPPFVFAHIGQCIPRKNHILFLQAAALVLPQMPAVRFLVIGDDIFAAGPSAYKQKLRRLASALNLTPRLQWLSWQDDMTSLWPRIHCLVHTAENEPLGRVIIEAWAYKIPVVAVRSAGPAEIIDHNRTGILVPPRDPDALARTLLDLAADGSRCQRLAAAGYRCARHRFSPPHIADRVACLYNRLSCEQNA